MRVLLLPVAAVALTVASATPAGAVPSTVPARPIPRVALVAADGTGQFTSVQAAVDAVPSGNSDRFTVLISKGVYRELVHVPRDKPHISFVGRGLDPRDVVITFDNANGTPKPGGGTYGTSGSASVTIDGDDFQAYNLTFENSFDEAAHPEFSGHQAVAILTRADRLIFANVRFLGNQDTLYANSADAATVGRAYFTRCYVSGDVDFIFGRATAVFDNCLVNALDRGQSNNGYITAASTTITNPYGFLFTHCTFASDAPAKTFYLGRPWHPSNDPNAIAQVTIRDSWLGAEVRDTAWSDFGAMWPWRDARYFEYNNTGPGALISPDRPQLTADQAAAGTPSAYFGDWQPVPRF